MGIEPAPRRLESPILRAKQQRIEEFCAGVKVAAALPPLVHQRGYPSAITVDNAGEFVGRAMDALAYAHYVRPPSGHAGHGSRRRGHA